MVMIHVAPPPHSHPLRFLILSSRKNGWRRATQSLCVVRGPARSSHLVRPFMIDASHLDWFCHGCGRGRLALFGAEFKMCHVVDNLFLGMRLGGNTAGQSREGVLVVLVVGQTGKRVLAGIFAICRDLRMMLLSPCPSYSCPGFACLPFARLAPSISPPPQGVRRGQGRIGRRR